MIIVGATGEQSLYKLKWLIISNKAADQQKKINVAQNKTKVSLKIIWQHKTNYSNGNKVCK